MSAFWCRASTLRSKCEITTSTAASSGPSNSLVTALQARACSAPTRCHCRLRADDLPLARRRRDRVVGRVVVRIMRDRRIAQILGRTREAISMHIGASGDGQYFVRNAIASSSDANEQINVRVCTGLGEDLEIDLRDHGERAVAADHTASSCRTRRRSLRRVRRLSRCVRQR